MPPEVGWRRAVQIALLEEARPEAPLRHEITDGQQAVAALPPEPESTATRRRKEKERAGQLRLL